MVNILNSETYLFISSKKIFITVKNNFNEKIYYEELLIKETSINDYFEKIDRFLGQNIFKIEKKFQNFVERISIISDLNIFFTFGISIKRNNFNNLINSKDLNHLLYEAKDVCKKTLDQKKIIHMIISNYNVDNKNYTFFLKILSVKAIL